MEQNVVLIQENLDTSDPHGYFIKSEANFTSPTKRSFLNECIRQIYILNGKGNVLPLTPSPIEFNKAQIWNAVNTLLQPLRIVNKRDSIDRIKRQLFREAREKTRKIIKPQKLQAIQTEFCYYKESRYSLGARKIRRNYLEAARLQILATQPVTAVNLKRSKPDDDDLSIDTPAGSFQIASSTLSEICKYHKNMARSHVAKRPRTMAEQLKRERNTEACRLSRRAKKLEDLLYEEQYRAHLQTNQKVMEESIRSIYYMKALLSLMVDQEENLYV